jgi:type IV secretion system protein VirB6
MKLAVRQIIVLATYLVLAISTGNAYATTFGETCGTLPVVDDSGYLNNDTAYGYIKKSLDIKTYVKDGCSSQGSFKFCIKNQSGSSEACEQASIKDGASALLKTLSTNPDIGGDPILGEIALSVKTIGNQSCLVMPTSRGTMPLLCLDSTITSAVAQETLESVCKNIDESCYSANSKTQSLLSFSGLTVHCLRNTLDKVLYIGIECPITDGENAFTSLRPFAGFQEAMKAAVRAALILYVMVYGFKLVMNKEYADLNKIALFLVKFFFVVYFAVGLGTKTLTNGVEVSHNGMTELALPIFTELTTSFAEMVFFAGGSQGLCSFDPDKYEDGYSFYRLWDAIDCRVGYYLGMQILYNIGDVIGSIPGGTTTAVGKAIEIGKYKDNVNKYKALTKEGSFSFFVVLCAFFLGGNIIIVVLGLVFAVVLMSVLLYFISAYLVCLVTLYVMAYISPIFVPMLLFDRTKGYFDSWLKIVVSCTLQPAVIAGFIAMLLTMYDSAIYGNCEFQRYDYTAGDFSFSTFELRLPDAEEEKCESSLGYKLLAYYNGAGWESKDVLLFTLVSLRDILNVLPSLVYVVIYVIVFYFFIQSVNEFASDITGGPSLSAVTTSPTALIDKAMAAASMIASSAASRASGGNLKVAEQVTGGMISRDKLSTGGAQSGDKISTGGSKSGDKISTGGGDGQ